MTDQPPAPGYDEITVTAPASRTLCHSREHARLGVQAAAVVTFGDLGNRWQPGAVWQDCWGRSFAMCGECWDTTRHIAQARRPGLVIIDTANARASPRGPVGHAGRACLEAGRQPRAAGCPAP